MGKYVICDDELYHYGVKGMRWGIRKKYPNGSLNKKKQLKIVRVMEYDKYGQIGDERPERYRKKFNKYIKEKHADIPAGTEVQHISVNKNIALKNRQFYVAHDEQDKLMYKSFLSKWHGDGKHYVHDYLLKEDLKIPSQYDNSRILAEAMEKVGFSKSASMIVNAYYSYHPQIKEKINKKYGGQVRNWDITNMFNNLCTHPKIFDTEVGKQYKKLLKENGYNAIVDFNDSYENRLAVDPIILLDGKKCLTKVRVSELSDEDIKAGQKKFDEIIKLRRII